MSLSDHSAAPDRAEPVPASRGGSARTRWLVRLLSAIAIAGGVVVLPFGFMVKAFAESPSTAQPWDLLFLGVPMLLIASGVFGLVITTLQATRNASALIPPTAARPGITGIDRLY